MKFEWRLYFMTDIFAFLSYIFVVTFTPGPNNIISMYNAKLFGYKKTLPFLLGICAGVFIIMIACAYFNLLLSNVMPRFKLVMGIIGALYMLYLAFVVVKSSYSGDNSPNQIEKLNTFPRGLLLQFINPKTIIYGITVMSGFVIPYYKSHLYLIFFSFILTLVAFLALSLWSVFGMLIQKLLSKPVFKKVFNVIMAILLVYCALSISGIFELFSDK